MQTLSANRRTLETDALKICRRLVWWVDGWVSGWYFRCRHLVYRTVPRKRGFYYRWRPTGPEFKRESQMVRLVFAIQSNPHDCNSAAPFRVRDATTHGSHHHQIAVIILWEGSVRICIDVPASDADDGSKSCRRRFSVELKAGVSRWIRRLQYTLQVCIYLPSYNTRHFSVRIHTQI